jgi:hypothetical protein
LPKIKEVRCIRTRHNLSWTIVKVIDNLSLDTGPVGGQEHTTIEIRAQFEER